jgi:hypothetical protein
MQIVLVWPPVACNMNEIDQNLHATGGHAGTVCMPLAATRVQFGCDWWPLGYIIIIFFSIGKSTSSAHACDYSADGPSIFGLENALVL